MKQNLYSSSHKDNQNKLYQANYDRIFKKQAPETVKVQRSKQGAYQGKQKIVDWDCVTNVFNAMLKWQKNNNE